MSHQHFCHIAGHYWQCEGTALRGADTEPSVCICLPCELPLEGFDHSACHAPIELLACAEHRWADETTAARPQGEHEAEPALLQDDDGNRAYGFCLWCGKTFYCWAEVEAHNADNMKGCAVYQELASRPGGCSCLPPILRDKLQEAGLLNDDSGQPKLPKRGLLQ
jgi:hypothetical protein